MEDTSNDVMFTLSEIAYTSTNLLMYIEWTPTLHGRCNMIPPGDAFPVHRFFYTAEVVEKFYTYKHTHTHKWTQIMSMLRWCNCLCQGSSWLVRLVHTSGHSVVQLCAHVRWVCSLFRLGYVEAGYVTMALPLCVERCWQRLNAIFLVFTQRC